MIHFVGAGSGAADLITLRGKKFLEEADVIIYAGSLVNPQLLDYAKENCEIYNSAKMTLEEVLDVMFAAEQAGRTTVRLHTGDPCLYGAIREQMDVLDEKKIAYDYTPGVSSFSGAASALNLEYTLPEVSQSVIITRMEGRTPVPEKESIQSFAAHHATMVIFLSTGMLKELSRRLIEGGYEEDTPAAIVYKATWPDEKPFVCTVGTLAETAEANNITKTALIIVGDVVTHSHYDRSKLYDPGFTTEFREASK
ncbi:MAG: precorrin-4 C(11)-methyltransferase [Eubacteriales bacterium]|nr:precorrin-4 C(11)-methyltransferase [Eubacteriales bacterium]